MAEKKLNANVEYDGDGKLLSDISSSEPLKKKTVKKTPVKKTTTKKVVKKAPVKKTTTKKTPAKKTTTKKTTKKVVKKVVKKVEKVEPVAIVESVPNNKALYNNMRLEGSFILKYNGTVVYDSDKSSAILDFQDKYFTLNGRMFKYNGLNFKFKK